MFGRRVELKTPEQLALMRRAGLLLEQAHDRMAAMVEPGISTAELDAAAARVIAEGGGEPNFLGYHGFPATVCVSVNDEIVHGIPGPCVLREGDVVSIDAGCIVEGWHSDAARTHIVGTPRSEDDKWLVECTRQAMWEGIAQFARADRVGEIGAAIEDFVERVAGDTLEFLEDFGGHGIGSAMHQAPDVMNYRTRARGPRIAPGMVVAIEPMVVAGDASYRIAEDEWTVIATSGARAAHWEHSVARTNDGIFVLTAADGGRAELEARGIRIAPEPV